MQIDLGRHYFYFGEKGIASSSIAKLVLRFATLALVLIGVYVLYLDIVSDIPARHPHAHHGRSHGDRPHRTKQEPIPWKQPVVPPHLQNADQEDPELIRHIHKHWLLAPSGERMTLNNPDVVDRSQAGQTLCVDRLLKERKHGFFVEAGASNGETFSNTLFLERFRNWTGLLVEPSPDYFAEVRSKHRNAYMINACLSPTTRPMVLNFTVAKLMSALDDYVAEGQMEVIQKPKRFAETIKVQCFPIYSILKALDTSHIDYFSLDVAGPELMVLKTLPLRDIYVDVLSVEFRVAKNKAASQNKMNHIVHYMSNYGYLFGGKLMRLDVILQKTTNLRPDPVCFPQRTKSF